VLDFGIADDERMGTPGYLPPEHDLSPSADVYALGVVWFEAVRGRRPEPGETLGGLQARCMVAATARPSAAEIAVALGVAPGDQAVEKVGEQAAAYEAALAYRAMAPEPVPGPTLALTGSRSPSHSHSHSRSPERHGRLLLVAGGTTAAAVAAVGLMLGGAAFRPVAAPFSASPTGPPSSAKHLAAPRQPVTDSSPPRLAQRSARSASPQPTARPRLLRTSPLGVVKALSRMRRTLDEGLAAREVRMDVAVDLDNAIDGLQAQLTAGDPVDVDRRVGQLREKIAERVRDGGLTKPRAELLNQTLSGV